MIESKVIKGMADARSAIVFCGNEDEKYAYEIIALRLAEALAEEDHIDKHEYMNQFGMKLEEGGIWKLK